MGWTEDALRREYRILREELNAVARRGAPAGADVGSALGLLARFLEQTERTSLRALRLATAAGAT